MKKPIGTIKTYFKDELLVKVTPFAGGFWLYGFFDKYNFEARVIDAACSDCINGGRVTNLTAFNSYFTEDSSFYTQVARYSGEWDIRPQGGTVRAKVDALIAHLEELPTSEVFEA